MSLIGHGAQVKRCNQILKRNTLSHAYIFSGPSHLGKRKIAHMFAGAIIEGRLEISEEMSTNARGLCIEITPPREIKKGIVKEKSIDVTLIRKAQEQIALHPGGKNRQVLLIDEAQKMTVQAQNALLKTLEEPNADTVIILITVNKDALLSTIISRCEAQEFYTLHLDELKNSDLGADAQSDELFVLAMGRPGLVVHMREDADFLEKRREYWNIWKELQGSDIPHRIRLGEVLAKNVIDTQGMFEFWISLLREDVISGRRDVGKNYSAIQVLGRGLEVLRSSNANARLLIENVLLAI